MGSLGIAADGPNRLRDQRGDTIAVYVRRRALVASCKLCRKARYGLVIAFGTTGLARGRSFIIDACQKIFPGFRMPSGSSAFLSTRISAISLSLRQTER